MHTVLLSLGANIGDLRTTISRAIELIGQTVLTDVRASPFYQTAPVGFTDQPDFLNCAVVGLSSASAREIHDACKDIERQLGRQKRERWHEREIDIDVILVGNIIYDDDDVHIPHLRMHERLFVLQPACDLIPDAICPRTGMTLKEHLDRL